MLFLQLQSILTALASLISCISTLFTLIFYVIFRKYITNKRHQYIINLILADFINSLNNSVSGIYVILNGGLNEGPGCSANGLIGQVSILAVDYSVLVIAIITYIALARPEQFERFQSAWKGWRKRLLLMLPWVAGITTGLVGYLLPGYYSAPGVNWCWLPPDPVYWRYVLTHGHRIIIMFVIAVLYIRIFLVLRAHQCHTQLYKTQTPESSPYRTEFKDLPPTPLSFNASLLPRIESKVKSPKNHVYTPGNGLSPCSTVAIQQQIKQGSLHSPSSTKSKSSEQYNKEKRLKKAMVRLTLFPLAYIILWGPGLVQRALQAFGINPLWLVFLFTVLSQLLGFADAVLYGWNENFTQLFRKKVPSVRQLLKSFLLCGHHTQVKASNSSTYSSPARNYVKETELHQIVVKPVYYNS